MNLDFNRAMKNMQNRTILPISKIIIAKMTAKQVDQHKNQSTGLAKYNSRGLTH